MSIRVLQGDDDVQENGCFVMMINLFYASIVWQI